jgi:hypothetical protein
MPAAVESGVALAPGKPELSRREVHRIVDDCYEQAVTTPRGHPRALMITDCVRMKDLFSPPDLRQGVACAMAGNWCESSRRYR